MHAALWFLGLFGAAVAVALFAGNNQGTITLFWPPWRIDLSLNMVVLLSVGCFVVIYGAMRGLDALWALPRQAQRWRQQQKERAMHSALLEALALQLAGRFLRARKAALAALAQESALATATAAASVSSAALSHRGPLRALAHLIAAECSHALQDSTSREMHLTQALEQASTSRKPHEQILREGLQLRAARWSLDERDSETALQRLAVLPQGAARRTLALRVKLKAARLAGHTLTALETARLLGKHRAFSPIAAQSIVRGLATEWIHSAHDSAQLQQVWQRLESTERAMPELAIEAAQRLLALGGDSAQVRTWLLPIWDRMLTGPEALPPTQALRLIHTLELALSSLDSIWLARIESAHTQHPHDARLCYLAAAACLHSQLWGKAEQLFGQAVMHLDAPPLRVNAWCHLARLAEQRSDTTAAAQAWKKAALERSAR